MHPGVPPSRIYLSCVSAAAGRGLARLASRAPPPLPHRADCPHARVPALTRGHRGEAAPEICRRVYSSEVAAETPRKACGDRDARCARGNRMGGTRRTRAGIAALAALTILLPTLSVAGLHRDVLASPTSQAANSPFGVVITA